MSAPKRPGGRPRPPGALAEFRATGTRYRRPVQRHAPGAGPRAAWAFVVVALVVGFGTIAWIVSTGLDARTAVPATATPTAPAVAPSPSPGASPALALTGDRVAASAEPTPSPRPLTVDFPREADILISGRINAFGHAPPGAAIRVADRRGSATARADGLWMLRVELEPGDNELRFELVDDPSGAITVRVVHQPR